MFIPKKFSNTTAPVTYKIDHGMVVDTILLNAKYQKCDLVLIGGYKANPVIEIVQGSLVDEMLRKSTIPTLICR